MKVGFVVYLLLVTAHHALLEDVDGDLSTALGPTFEGQDDVARPTKHKEGNFEAPLENKKHGELFSKRWRSLYSDQQLERQSPWMPADTQPADGTFEVRFYQKQWRAYSFTPCLRQSVAASAGYSQLYLYFLGFNFQRFSYPLTYPVIQEVDVTSDPTQRGKDGGTERERFEIQEFTDCQVSYTSWFYLPISSDMYAPWAMDISISSMEVPVETYFIREYFGNYTGAYCNEQARHLANTLAGHGKLFDVNVWHCATYEVAASEQEIRYEVMIKEITDV